MIPIPRHAPKHARLRQQPVFDRQPVHAGEFTRVVRGGNQLRVERVARDELVERPDSVARLIQRAPHLGRMPGRDPIMNR